MKRIYMKSSITLMVIAITVLPIWSASRAAEPKDPVLPGLHILWERAFGGAKMDGGYSVDVTSDGGFIIAGYTHSSGAGGSDIYVIKTDHRGTRIWERTFGGTKDDIAYCVRQTSDGGYIIAGEWGKSQHNFGSAFLVKFDSEGNLDPMWPVNPQLYGPGRFRHVEETTEDGPIFRGYIATGTKPRSIPDGPDVYVVKTFEDGTEEWSGSYTTSHGTHDYCEEGHCVQQTSPPGYIICGYTVNPYLGKNSGFSRSKAPASDLYLIKLEPSGYKEWDWAHGGFGQDEGWCVQQIAEGDHYVLCGYRQGDNHTGLWLVVVEPDPSPWPPIRVEKEAIFYGKESAVGRSVRQTSDGGYIAVGCTRKYPEPLGVYIVKTDKSLSLDQEMTAGNPWRDEIREVQEIACGRYIAIGSRALSPTNSDVYLVRINDGFPREIPMMAPGVSESDGQSIPTEEMSSATRFDLLPNFPNPFNPETWMPYMLMEKVSDVTISIYNATGQMVRTLHLGGKEPGLYVKKDSAAYWDGKDESGEPVGSGIYFYQIRAGDSTVTRKMVVVK